MFSEIRPNCGSQKHASFFTWQLINKLLKASFTKERQPNSLEHEDCSWWQSRKTRLQWLMWPSPLNASERISEQALSCSLEGWSIYFLRLASLAISELATFDLSMIAVALTPSWLVWIIAVMPLWLYFLSFLFCSVLFLNSNFIYYTSVSCVWFLLPFVSLQSNWAWKPSKLGLSISFSLWGFSSLLTL